MAVDTRDKRASVIGVSLPTVRLLPNPDATVAEADFEMIAPMLYAGTQAAGVGSPTWARYAGTRHMGQGQKFGRSW